MEAIIPRWKWRTFGASFGEADRRFSALEPDRVQESGEVYLLSRNTNANVKIRDRLMDIKRLERVNAVASGFWAAGVGVWHITSGAGGHPGGDGRRSVLCCLRSRVCLLSEGSRQERPSARGPWLTREAPDVRSLWSASLPNGA